MDIFCNVQHNVDVNKFSAYILRSYINYSGGKRERIKLVRVHAQYSWISLIQTRLFRNPRYFKLKTISLVFALQSLTIGYFEPLLFLSFESLKFSWVQLYI